MSKDQPIDGGSNRNVQLLLSALTVGLGVLLLVYMVIVEDEPGALPLLLIALGSGWYLTTRTRLRSHHKQLRRATGKVVRHPGPDRPQ